MTPVRLDGNRGAAGHLIRHTADCILIADSVTEHGCQLGWLTVFSDLTGTKPSANTLRLPLA